MPVMIPGRAIGSTSKNDTDSRPKKRNRSIANAAIEPSTSAIAVVAAPTFSERKNDERASGLCQATRNQCSVQPGIGQLWMFELLRDDDERDPEEGDDECRPDAEPDARGAAFHQRASNAPSLRAIRRYPPITRTGTVANAAANGTFALMPMKS